MDDSQLDTAGSPRRNASLLPRVLRFWRQGETGEELVLCLNRCRRARDGTCDDDNGRCAEGMDCVDCGPRHVPPSASAKRRRWAVPAAALDVVLVTLMTADRVAALHRLAASWRWLISVAYLSSSFADDAAAGLQLLRLAGKPVPHEDLLTLSVVEDRGYREPRNRFPFNLLRNIAVDAAPADLVFVVDVDFEPHAMSLLSSAPVSAEDRTARLRRMVAVPPVSVALPAARACSKLTRCGSAASAALRYWLPLLRLSPHLALVRSRPISPDLARPRPRHARICIWATWQVVPAFELNATTASRLPLAYAL